MSCSAPPRDLHSFPTRRSSDLWISDTPITRKSSFMNASRSATLAPVVAIELDDSTLYPRDRAERDRKSTRLNSSHVSISYAVFCLKKKMRSLEDTDALRALHIA